MVSSYTVFLLLPVVGLAIGDQCICPAIYQPVCASNGQIFSSPCNLQCYNKNNNKSLTVSRKCVSSNGPYRKSRRAIDIPLRQCYDQCPKEFKDVCGTNLIVYRNICYLQCDAMRDSTLRPVPNCP